LIFKNDIFLTVSDDSSIKFWNTNNEDEENSLTGHSSWVISATILKNGTVVTTGADKTIRFWQES
jgi:WD40 repeat protein